MKTCKQCGTTKTESDFGAHDKTADRLNYRCRECQKAYLRAYSRAKSLEKVDLDVHGTFHLCPNESSQFRFARKIAKADNGCWNWTGNIHSKGGYPRVWFSRHDDRLAHRMAYEWAVGPIPDGLTIDHLCRNRACVNPAHLEAVTRGENTLRGDSPFSKNARKTHCLRGHEFTPENTYVYAGSRSCRTCTNMLKRQRRSVATHHPSRI